MFDRINLVVNTLSMIGTVSAVYVAIFLYYVGSLPEIVAYLKHDRDSGCVYLFIENKGKGMAKNIKILSFDYELVDESYRDYVRGNSFLSKGIPVLVSGENRNTIVMGCRDLKDYESVVSEIEISYERKGLFRTVTSTAIYPIDYYSFVGSLYTKSDLHRIAVALEKHV